MNSVSVGLRRLLASVTTVASFSLVASGLSPAVAQPLEPVDETAVTAEQTDWRPDAVSAQITARSVGERVEDKSQRTSSSQVFANPDGTWTLESFTTPKFREDADGELALVDESPALGSDGKAFIGVDTEISVSTGEKLGRNGSTELVHLQGSGEKSDVSMSLGWEGDLPKPLIEEGKAIFGEGIEVPVVEHEPALILPQSVQISRLPAPEEQERSPTADPTPTETSSEKSLEEENQSQETDVPTSPSPRESAPNPPAEPETTETEPVVPEMEASVEAPQTETPQESEPEKITSIDARVEVEPTRTGFSHTVILDEAPEGEVRLRFPLELSKGLKASFIEDTGDIQVVDKSGERVFFAAAPTMWDAKVDEASGLFSAETRVKTELITEDGQQILVLTAPEEWLTAPEREYPVTIDPTWTTVASTDTWVQTGETGSKAGSTELRVGTFDGGKTRAMSYMKFNTSALTGKKIEKAEVKMNNYYSYSCYAQEIRLQRVTGTWESSTLRYTNQPTSTRTGEGIQTASKGYSASCPGGTVYYPATAIAQHWADKPAENHGVKLIAANATNNYSWKRYRSANYVLGEAHSAEPWLQVTYNSYPNTPSGVSFAAGQMTTYSSGASAVKYVKTLTPTIQATVADPDKGNVKAEFDLSKGSTAVLTKGVGSSIASGGVSKLKTPTLANGSTYTVKAFANDGKLRSKAAGATTTFIVDTSAPTTPTITSSAYSNNGWLKDVPAKNTLSISSPSADIAKFQYSKNGGTWTDLTAAGTGPRTASLVWDAKGSNRLQVKAIDKAGHVSGVSTFAFMNGLASLGSPRAGTTTSDEFKVQATAPASPAGTITPRIYWRPAGTGTSDATATGGTTGWIEGRVLDPIPANSAAKVDTALQIANQPANKLADLGKSRVPALVEIQVCFTYQSPSKVQCTTNSTNKPQAVTKLPHAFGGAYPVADAGPGQVALSTGELNLSDDDVSVDAGNTGLSIARTYSSYSGLGASSKVFGPGWRVNLDGPDEGLAGLFVAESTVVDGSITLIDDEQNAMTFRQPGNGKTSLLAGTYAPADDGAKESGLKLTLTGSGTSARINVHEADGTITTFLKGKELDAGLKVYEWTPEKVAGSGSSGATSFVRNATTGLTTRIIAAADASLKCATTFVKGCRALDLAYDASNRLSSVKFTAFNPASSKVESVEVAKYAYNAAGQLSTVTDPRGTPAHVTTYTYGANSAAGVPLVTSIQETGDAKTSFTYGKGAENGREDWLESVRRTNPTGSGETQTARFVYGIDPKTANTNLPDLRAGAVKLWEQDQIPARGAAVFSMDKQINTSIAGKVITGTDWRHADLQYWDSQNMVTNTASYGAGAWQFDATVYDKDENVIRSYTSGAIAQIRALHKDGEHVGGVVSGHTDFATVNLHTNNAAGTFITDTWDPVAPNQQGEPTRTHAKNTYTAVTDLNEAGLPRMLPLTVTTTEATNGPVNASATGEQVISKTTNGYNAKGTHNGKTATDKTNATSGWVHETPITITKDMGSGNAAIVTRTWLDEQGRIVEFLQPTSAGNDAGTTRSIYYTATANSLDTACGLKPEYAGLLCKSVPLGAGSVSTFNETFDMFLRPLKTHEIGTGSATASKRTTTMTYRPDGQELKTTITATGSTAVGVSEALYDSYGRKNGTRTLASGSTPQTQVTWELDLWGRTTSYTNSLGEKTTTTYNTIGEVGTETTPKSKTTYWYGALGGDGNAEYRGIPTKMTVSNHGAAGTTGTYTATYDAAGNITKQGMPGGLSQTQEYDSAGRPTTLGYHGELTNPNGTKYTGTWVAWNQTRNTAGNIVAESTPDGALFSTATSGDPAAAYEKTYAYDRASRLIKVTDRTAGAGEEINTDPTEGEITACTTRSYTFDGNGNRTKLVTTNNKDCGTSGATTRTWAFDKADRLTSTGNIFDGLGRQTSIPAIDAPRTDTTAAGKDPITMGYYANDAARTIKRGTITTTIGMDPEDRRLTLGNGTTVDTNHYTGSGDNPSWVERKQGANVVSETRYESVIGGDLGITIEDNRAKLAINNPHGDTVATVTLPASGNATGIDAWALFDEYGNQQSTPVNTGNTTYAWHGADQRAFDASGLILMGARLYNSVTGLFTSRDPVTGGNSTAYAYPQDPIGMNDITGLLGWKDVWSGAKNAWKNPYVRVAVNVASIAVPGGLFVRGAITAYKGYKLYKTVKAAGSSAKDLSATRGASAVAGRLWARSVKKKPYKWAQNQGNKKAYMLRGKVRQYRSPSKKTGSARNGYYSNFNGPNKFNLHVKITNPKRSWSKWK